MAAPMLSKSQKAACLKKPAAKSTKVRSKNILCGDNSSWPRASKEVEELILMKLSETFKKLPNIFKPVRSSSKIDQEAKRKVRVQLDLGTNCVSRSLEQDRLACVLVSGKVTPAAAVDHIIAVARERGCPLLCLDSLGTTLAKVTKSKSFPICIGFKKLVVNIRADFIDVISLVKQNTTTHRSLSKKIDLVGKKTPSERPQLPESLRPLSLDASTNEAVREELKRIFTSASFKEAQNKMASKDRKKKKSKEKKKLKQYYRKWFHTHFESGKKTVTDFVGRGKIQLVLIIPELLSILMSESPKMSLLSIARDQDCPVVCVSNLSMVICADTYKALAVLGIKKDSCLPMHTTSAFNTVVEKCLTFMRTAPLPAQEMDVQELNQSDDTPKELTREKDDESMKEDYSFLYVSKKDSTDLQEKALKLKEEQDKTSKQLSFDSDFISFSGSDSTATTESNTSILGKRKSQKPLIAAARLKPKKMLMDKTNGGGAKNAQPQANMSGNALGFISFSSSLQKPDGPEGMATDQGADDALQFAISREGNQSQKSTVAKNEEGMDSITTEQQDTSSSASVLGLDPNVTLITDKDKEVQHVANIFSATAKKGKGEDKKRHDQEGFVSFGYTEANIHTMVTNSDRQKKKKKGKN